MNLNLEFTDPEIIKLFVNAQGDPTHVAQPPGLRGTQFGKPCFIECLQSPVMIFIISMFHNIYLLQLGCYPVAVVFFFF